MSTRKRLPSLLNRVLWCRTNQNIRDLDSDLEGIYLATKTTPRWWFGQEANSIRDLMRANNRTQSRAVANRVIDEVIRRANALYVAIYAKPVFTDDEEPAKPEPALSTPVAPKKEGLDQ